jgi:hypothetical protein
MDDPVEFEDATGLVKVLPPRLAHVCSRILVKLLPCRLAHVCSRMLTSARQGGSAASCAGEWSYSCRRGSGQAASTGAFKGGGGGNGECRGSSCGGVGEACDPSR